MLGVLSAAYEVTAELQDKMLQLHSWREWQGVPLLPVLNTDCTWCQCGKSINLPSEDSNK